MTKSRDKRVIEHWLRLYNRLIGSTFKVVDWPDEDSTKKNIDAMCSDDDGKTLAVEHTLIHLSRVPKKTTRASYKRRGRWRTIQISFSGAMLSR